MSIAHPNRAEYATDEDYFAALDEYFEASLYSDLIVTAA